MLINDNDLANLINNFKGFIVLFKDLFMVVYKFAEFSEIKVSQTNEYLTTLFYKIVKTYHTPHPPKT